MHYVERCARDNVACPHRYSADQAGAGVSGSHGVHGKLQHLHVRLSGRPGSEDVDSDGLGVPAANHRSEGGCYGSACARGSPYSHGVPVCPTSHHEGNRYPRGSVAVQSSGGSTRCRSTKGERSGYHLDSHFAECSDLHRRSKGRTVRAEYRVRRPFSESTRGDFSHPGRL